jgi:hypothetical protein
MASTNLLPGYGTVTVTTADKTLLLPSYGAVREQAAAPPPPVSLNPPIITVII